MTLCMTLLFLMRMETIVLCLILLMPCLDKIFYKCYLCVFISMSSKSQCTRKIGVWFKQDVNCS